MTAPLNRWFSERDPRWYQIGALTFLLLYGAVRLQFEVSVGRIVVLLGTVLAAQYLCGRVVCLPRFDPKSALISGLSLCLLLRTNSWALLALTALVTIASKFVFRLRGKHLFNPTNFGLVSMMLFSGKAVWVSPGQWGDFAFFSFLVICLGGLVVTRASRADVTVAFLGCWMALLCARSFWLGEPMSIPLHRLQNGGLLIFSFFMISDPKTTPDSRAGRILFALLVALGAGFVQFKLFRTNGLLWSLATCSLAVPLIDRVLPGRRYHWRQSRKAPVAAANEPKTTKGTSYEPIPA
jgi:Na+-transporting NADH:ubiquinone oxidoreductase subunit NqrB